MQNKNILKTIYLFKNMTAEQLDKISELAEDEIYSGRDEIFAEGDAATGLYVIKYGSVKIARKAKTGEPIEVATLATGSHFGELAFIDGEKRSASAVALEKTEIIRFDYSKLSVLLKSNPEIAVVFYRELALFLSRRLRVTTNDLSFAREKNLMHM